MLKVHKFEFCWWFCALLFNCLLLITFPKFRLIARFFTNIHYTYQNSDGFGVLIAKDIAKAMGFIATMDYVAFYLIT